MRIFLQYAGIIFLSLFVGVGSVRAQVEPLPLAPPRPAPEEPQETAEEPPGDETDTEAAEGSEDGPNPKPEFKRPFVVIGPRLPTPIDAAETVEGQTAVLRQLDKMTGGTETFEVAVGEEADFGRLRVVLSACKAPPSGTLQGTMANLTIWDQKKSTPLPVFQGWMFADSPALSAMDHPRFDVWVISCTISGGGVASGSE